MAVTFIRIPVTNEELEILEERKGALTWREYFGLEDEK